MLVQSHVGYEEAATVRVLEDDADLVQPAHSSLRPPSPEGESDTEGVPEPDPEGEETMAFESRPSQFTPAFTSLGKIDLKDLFQSFRSDAQCAVLLSRRS